VASKYKNKIGSKKITGWAGLEKKPGSDDPGFVINFRCTV
jgi:hypothetical protein